eukprot:9706074-Lingulodinium_polyedra.AAC.1
MAKSSDSDRPPTSPVIAIAISMTCLCQCMPPPLTHRRDLLLSWLKVHPMQPTQAANHSMA